MNLNPRRAAMNGWWLVICGVLAATARDARGQDADLRPKSLRVEYLPRPLAVDATAPRFDWRLVASRGDARGLRQTAYQVAVDTTLEGLESGQASLWDSGRVESDATAQIAYAGKTLQSGQRCYWRVRVWDQDGRTSAWSQTHEFGMGLLRPEDWKAQWITFRDESPLHTDREQLALPPASYFRRPFALKGQVRRAVVYASALGNYRLSLNGRELSDAYFLPGWTDYRQRVLYNAFDVTTELREGDNALGAILTEGWYAGYVGYGLLVGYGPHRSGKNFYGKTPALLAQLQIEYLDGRAETILTDGQWRVTHEGPEREADILMGETYDARREMPGWNQPGFDDSQWDTAIPAADNGRAPATFFEAGAERDVDLGFAAPPLMRAYTAPPIRITEELPARRITEPMPGVFVFDLGQNFAGVVRLRVKAPAGTRIQLRHGEMLHPDGRLMTENLRRARATDAYVCRGDAQGETWTPRFTYHGFQYVEVMGLPAKPDLDAVTGLVIHNETPLTSSFACSDEVMTKFWRNTQWTQRANFIELPTDCPQRDERLGWMGDAQVYVRTASFNADVAAFFTKWIDDVREAQRTAGPSDGAYPDYAPYPMAHGKPGATHGTAWTDAGVICPWTIWQVYGDTRILELHWDSMTRFMEWRRRADPELKGVKIGNTWGDWLNVNEETPIEFVDLCYHAYSARLMAEMAEVLGKHSEAAAYRRLFGQLASSFEKLYLSADGTVGVPTQSGYVLPLWIGLIPPDRVAAASEKLAERIAANDHRMATGFLGTRSLLLALTDSGHHDLAARLFQSRKFPSWGYEVEQGANSVWERWDSFTKEHGFDGATGTNNAAMNSFSHYSFGAVMEWAFRRLVGIDLVEPGYRRIRIAPRPPAAGSNPDARPIEWVNAEYESPRGAIQVSWRVGEGSFALQTSIPPNVRATVVLPAARAARVWLDGEDLDGSKQFSVERDEASARIELGSGQYRFDVR